MKETLTYFNLTSDNPYWELLRSTNQLHITARQKHAELLALCREKGVAFKDLEAHLLKEAKKCGLYRATSYDEKTKKMKYPAKRQLTNLGWFVCMENFIKWAYRNFYDYDLTNEERNQKMKPRKVAKAVIVSKDASGNKTEKTVEVSGATISQVLNTPSPSSTPEVPSANSITRPVDANMSLAQVQAIILRNFAVLGKICEDYSKKNGPGAIEAFNVLMLELGQDDEIIEYDEETISLVA